VAAVQHSIRSYVVARGHPDWRSFGLSVSKSVSWEFKRLVTLQSQSPPDPKAPTQVILRPHGVYVSDSTPPTRFRVPFATPRPEASPTDSPLPLEPVSPSTPAASGYSKNLLVEISAHRLIDLEFLK